MSTHTFTLETYSGAASCWCQHSPPNIKEMSVGGELPVSEGKSIIRDIILRPSFGRGTKADVLPVLLDTSTIKEMSMVTDASRIYNSGCELADSI